MILKKIEISGFKSFAKKDVLEFNSKITAIVGPNGSGKSNILEAFRFGLGEQSMRSMRGKRSEDLIFNGSNSESRANRASVKIFFNNTDRSFDIDFDEVVIERVVHRDSTSEYSINSSQVRLKDVYEILSSQHIGVSGHHIISQGEADKILNVSAKERRSMLEEVLGLKVFQHKKEESIKKLEKTKENIVAAENLRREIAPHLRFLIKQVNKVNETLGMKKELKTLYSDYLIREETYLNDRRSKIKKDKDDLENNLHILEEEMDSESKRNSNLYSDDVITKKLTEIENEIDKARQDKNELTLSLGRLEGMLYGERISLEKIDSTNPSLKININVVEEVFLRIDDHLNQAMSSDEPAIIKDIILKVQQEIKDFIDGEIVDAEKRQIEDKIRSSIKGLEEEIEVLKIKIEAANKIENEKRMEHNEVLEKLDKEKDEVRLKDKRLFEIRSEIQVIKAKMSTILAFEERINVEEAEFQREMVEAAVLLQGQTTFSRSELMSTNQNISVDEMLDEARSLQEDRRKKIERIKIRLEDLGAGGGEDILREYEETKERDEFLDNEISDLKKSADSLNVMIVELEEKMNKKFKEGLEKINVQFQEFFSIMFGGGEASLKIVKEKKKIRKADKDDGEGLDDITIEDDQIEEEEGIEIRVNLPRKKIKGLMALSGGERALTSIALIFSMSQINPPPFIVLDETDAALDEANSRKYGDMIENLSKYSQLILITHNRETMSRAGIIYGVTMGSNGISKLLSIDFEEALSSAN